MSGDISCFLCVKPTDLLPEDCREVFPPDLVRLGVTHMHEHGSSEVRRHEGTNGNVDEVENEVVVGVNEIGIHASFGEGVDELAKGPGEERQDDAMAQAANDPQEQHELLRPAGEAEEGEE